VLVDSFRLWQFLDRDPVHVVEHAVTQLACGEIGMELPEGTDRSFGAVLKITWQLGRKLFGELARSVDRNDRVDVIRLSVPIFVCLRGGCWRDAVTRGCNQPEARLFKQELIHNQGFLRLAETRVGERRY
jgi:hypothetical protein